MQATTPHTRHTRTESGTGLTAHCSLRPVRRAAIMRGRVSSFASPQAQHSAGPRNEVRLTRSKVAGVRAAAAPDQSSTIVIARVALHPHHQNQVREWA
jgi:hypothetical protein